jgi:hypothetical protein
MRVPSLAPIWLLPTSGAVFFKTLLSRGQSASILGTIFNPVLWSTLLFRGVDLIRVILISMEGQCTISALRQTFYLNEHRLIHCSQYETSK